MGLFQKMARGAASRMQKRNAGAPPAMAGGMMGQMKQHMAPGAAAGGLKRPQMSGIQAGAMKRLQKRMKFGR